jgi:hypothetical protein
MTAGGCAGGYWRCLWARRNLIQRTARARLLRNHAGIELSVAPMGWRPTDIHLRLPDLDDPGILRMPGGEDGPLTAN